MTPKQASALAFEMIHKFNKTYHSLSDALFTQSLKGFDHIIFEGAQGFFLDENFGTAPHNTWSTTTPKNALALCKRFGIPRSEVTIYGCMRTYATRHGAGPLPYEGDSRRASQ
jgi:adenylosuccinate synthase